MVPQKKVCDEENGKKQVADSYFFVKRNGNAGMRKDWCAGREVWYRFVRGTCVERYGVW